MKRIVVLCFVAIALIALGQVGATDPATGSKILEAVPLPDNAVSTGHPAGVPKAGRASGTIQYDPGSIGAWCQSCGGLVIGNVFNSANSTGGSYLPILAPGSITRMTFNALGGNSASTAQLYIFGLGETSPAKANRALLAHGTATGVVPAGGVTVVPNVYTFASPVTYPDSAFFAGIVNTATSSGSPFAAVTPGLATASNLGQGKHDYIMTTGGSPMGSFSGVFAAAVRVSGNVIVPVELMAFDVE